MHLRIIQQEKQKKFKMFSLKWRRPDDLEFPKVWRRFEKKTKDGETLKFKIQDATEDYYEDIINMMINGYINEEIWNTSTGCNSDPSFIETFTGYIQGYAFPQKVGLMCVLDDDGDDKPGADRPKLVAFNLTGVHVKEDQGDYTDMASSDSARLLLAMYEEAQKFFPKAFDKYNVDEYLGSMGLYVEPKYRGLAISQELLMARASLTKAIGLKVTSTIFTAASSQKNAARAGYVEDGAVAYSHFKQALDIDTKNGDTKEAKQMSCVVTDGV